MPCESHNLQNEKKNPEYSIISTILIIYLNNLKTRLIPHMRGVNVLTKVIYKAVTGCKPIAHYIYIYLYIIYIRMLNFIN